MREPTRRDFTRPDIGKSRSLSQVRAPPECDPCAALTADRDRDRSWIDRGRDLSRSVAKNLTLTDSARPLLAAMASKGASASVDGSSTATHGAGHVSDAIGAAHGEPSKSNSATGLVIARRAGP